MEWGVEASMPLYLSPYKEARKNAQLKALDALQTVQKQEGERAVIERYTRFCDAKARFGIRSEFLTVRTAISAKIQASRDRLGL